MFEEVSYVLQGKIRVAVLLALEKKPSTPTLLSKGLGTHQSTVSRAIRDLQEKNIVKCITSQARHYRFYEITETGIKILKEVKYVLKAEKE